MRDMQRTSEYGFYIKTLVVTKCFTVNWQRATQYTIPTCIALTYWKRIKVAQDFYIV